MYLRVFYNALDIHHNVFNFHQIKIFMKILILGGTKYLGLETANLLVDSGHKVTVVSRKKVNNHHISYEECDRKNLTKLKKVIVKIKPDFILDMICFDKKDAIDINTLFSDGTLDTISHYLIVSTSLIYNYADSYERVFDGVIPNKTDKYTKNKINAEIELHKNKFFPKITIARLPFIFSFDDYTERFQTFCEMSLSNKSIDFNDKVQISMVSKKDAAKCLSLLLFKKPLGFVDVANDGCMSLLELAMVIKKSCNNVSNSNFFHNEKIPYQTKKSICMRSSKIKSLRPLEIAIAEEAKNWIDVGN